MLNRTGYLSRAMPSGWRPAASPRVEALGWPPELATALQAELRAALARSPAWERARVAFRVTEDGVERLEREELAVTYRRAGLPQLAAQVRAAPVQRALVVLEGEPETAVLSVDADAWCAMEVPR